VTGTAWQTPSDAMQIGQAYSLGPKTPGSCIDQ